jgi:hypothetical protein
VIRAQTVSKPEQSTLENPSSTALHHPTMHCDQPKYQYAEQRERTDPDFLIQKQSRQ